MVSQAVGCTAAEHEEKKKKCAQRKELSLPAASSGAPAHVTVCWLCCRGTWQMDGCSWAGGGEKELRSDVKEEVAMKVKKE